MSPKIEQTTPVPYVEYEQMLNGNKLVIVANATPVKFDENGNHVPSMGGLATGVNPALKSVPNGSWIGCEGGYKYNGETGGLYDALGLASQETGFDMGGVRIDQETYRLYYSVFANSVLWPLFHGFGSFAEEQLDKAVETHDAWRAYEHVNRQFTQETKIATDGSDHIWVQDYHFLLFAKQFREQFPDRNNPLNFFLHIPFPSVEDLEVLPEQFRTSVIEGLLAYDQVGFQIEKRDVVNFIDALRTFFPEHRHAIYEATNNDSEGIGVSYVVHDRESGHMTKIGAYPISIDYDLFAHIPDKMQEDIDRYAAQLIGDMIGFTAGRADYTKGMPELIQTLDRLFEIKPQLKENVQWYLQYGRTRVGVKHEDQVYFCIKQLINEVNSKHGTDTWSPIKAYDGNLKRLELIAHFQKALIGAYPSLADGMALVPLEHIAASRPDAAIMIGEGAGVAHHLNAGYLFDDKHHAVVVDACDIERFAHQMLYLIEIPAIDRMYHMRQLKQAVINHTVEHWLNHFLKSANISAAQFITAAV